MWTTRSTARPGSAPSNPNASWRRARSPRAFARRTSRDSVDPGRPAVSHQPERVLEIEGVGQVDLRVDPDGAVEGDLVEMDIDVTLLRRLPALGLGGCRGRTGPSLLRPCGPAAPTNTSAPPGRGSGRPGRHPRAGEAWCGRRSGRPATTAAARPAPVPRAWGGGSAAPGSADLGRTPASVDTPSAAAYSINANSETSGAPAPATGRAVGEEPELACARCLGLVQHRPLDGRFGHPDLGSFPVGLVTAQHRKHSAVVADSVTVAVLVMEQSKHSTTDSHGSSFPLLHRGFEARR